LAREPFIEVALSGFAKVRRFLPGKAGFVMSPFSLGFLPVVEGFNLRRLLSRFHNVSKEGYKGANGC